MLERSDKSGGLESFATGHALRVVRQAVPQTVFAPVVLEPHEGLLVRGNAADLTAASLGGRWVRRMRYTLLVHSGSPYLWATVPGSCTSRGAISFLDTLIMRLLYAFIKH
jgi:hypothetical protein